jgi:hypothetical protein
MLTFREYRFPQYAGFYIENMPYIYAVLISLAMSCPEIGYEAGPDVAQEPPVPAEAKAAAQAAKELPEVLRKIAICESNDRHFKENGEVLTGKYDPRDIGRFQINKALWEDEAKKLGYDIYTEEGNEAFAVYLFEKQGTRPWFKSKYCWSKESAGW